MNLIVCISVFVIGLVVLVFNTFSCILFKPKTKQFKILTYYLLASSVEGIFCFAFYFIYPENNFFSSHFFFNIQLIFLGYFFYNLFDNKLHKKYVFFSALVIFLISTLQYIIEPNSFWQFNLFEIVGSCLLLIGFGLLNLYNTI